MADDRGESPGKGSVFSASCPSRAALELISGKWVLLIVPALADGPVRNNELLRRIDGISQKVLTQNLRNLHRAGLVERTDHDSVPPHVEYRLTPLGHSLNRALLPLDSWAEENFDSLRSTPSGQGAARRRAAGHKATT